MNAARDIIAASGAITLAYSERLLKGIPAESFASRPRVGGTVVESNHPAFVFGHLTVYAERLLLLCDVDGQKAGVPPAYHELFAAGKPCLDDPGRTIYPPIEEITAKYFSCWRTALELMGGVPPEVLSRQNPREQLRPLLPTIGAMASFLVVGHPMSHLGQVSVWRRCMGLGSAM